MVSLSLNVPYDFWPLYVYVNIWSDMFVSYAVFKITDVYFKKYQSLCTFEILFIKYSGTSLETFCLPTPI